MSLKWRFQHVTVKQMCSVVRAFQASVCSSAGYLSHKDSLSASFSAGEWRAEQRQAGGACSVASLVDDLLLSRARAACGPHSALLEPNFELGSGDSDSAGDAPVPLLSEAAGQATGNYTPVALPREAAVEDSAGDAPEALVRQTAWESGPAHRRQGVGSAAASQPWEAAGEPKPAERRDGCQVHELASLSASSEGSEGGTDNKEAIGGSAVVGSPPSGGYAPHPGTDSQDASGSSAVAWPPPAGGLTSHPITLQAVDEPSAICERALDWRAAADRKQPVLLPVRWPGGGSAASEGARAGAPGAAVWQAQPDRDQVFSDLHSRGCGRPSRMALPLKNVLVYSYLAQQPPAACPMRLWKVCTHDLHL